jgi:hypothetical protein
MPILAGMSVPPMVSKPEGLELDPDKFDQAVFDALPEWHRKRISESSTFHEMVKELNRRVMNTAE